MAKSFVLCQCPCRATTVGHIMAADPLAVFLGENPDIQDIDAFIIDVNGVPRGKRLPVASASKIFKSGVRMPRSAYAVDVWGQDVIPAGLVVETGDGDGVCVGVDTSLKRVPWLKTPTAQVLLSMSESDGKPFFADPRQVLKNILDLFSARGLKPVVAAELEFYLVDPQLSAQGHPVPPKSARTAKRSEMSHLYSMNEMGDFEAILNEIHEVCRTQGIPTDTTISENGPGQFEINLCHVDNALLAADQATLMKRTVRAVARKHDLDATFMAKPYGDKSGSGLHVHFSILDKNGKNIFAGSDIKGSDALRHAVGGILQHMTDSTLVFAPNVNSYRRFIPGAHAPTTISWGYDNRTSSIRIPESDIAATRIEHRVSGADANLYLILAAMLAAAYDGIINETDPGAPYTGNVWASNARRLPSNMYDALDAFENSAFIGKYFGTDYRRVYAACKRQEKEIMDARVNAAEHDAYLRDI